MTTYLGAHPRWGGGGGGAAGLLAPWAARLGQLDCIILTFQLASPHLVDFHRGGAEPTNLAKLATYKLLAEGSLKNACVQWWA